MRAPDVSLVVPIRNEAGNIAPLVAEIRERLDAAGLTWETILVDDGSTDGSAAEIDAAAAADHRVSVVRHPSGLGKSAALMGGFARSTGQDVAMLDGDGQDDPGEIPRLLEALRASPDVGLVNGWKTPRLDPWHKTFPSRVFNLLVGWVTGLRLHDHNCGLKLLRGDVARGLVLDTDMHRFIPVFVALGGHRVVERAVRHRPRIRGVSKYGWTRFFRGLADLGRVAGMLGDARLAGGGDRVTSLRRGTYVILATLALAAVAARIGAVSSVTTWALEKRLVDEAVARDREAGGPGDVGAIRDRIEREKRLVRPFLSGNDRSRWLTVRALVERGTFAVEEIAAEPGWDSIDTVVHADAAGTPHLYSSKPPLLAILCAVPYWIVQRSTGWTLGDHPFELGRMLLLVVGLVPLAVMIACTAGVVEGIGTSDWGRIWGVAVAACGTLLTSFAVVFTNHLPAAACTAASCWAIAGILAGTGRTPARFALAGGTAALAAACELPALAWLAAVLVLAFRTSPRRTLAAAVPPAAVVAAAALGTTWLAHGTVVPPYAHRTPSAAATPAAEGESWNPDNWYDYAFRLPNGKLVTSYWRNPRGIDTGEPSVATYALHAIVGHHGILSLTPAWLLVAPGLVLVTLRRRQDRSGEADLALAIALVSLVVIAFYLARPQIDRNYGGTSSGFRWVFWLAPLWVAAATPAADLLGRSRAGRGVALVLLGLSVVSVAFPTWNPWTLPWIQQWLVHCGWIAAP